MRKSGRKHWGFFLMVGFWILALCGGLLIPAMAAESTFSLSVTCESDGVKLSDMVWRVYRVGSKNTDGTYQLEGDFASYAVDTSDLSTTSALQDCANTLETFALLDGLAVLSGGRTESAGVVTFTDLSAGWYLLSGTPVTLNGKRYTPSPVLVELTDADGTLNWNVQPKFTVTDTPVGEETYTVKKVWLHDEDAPDNRSVTLKVGIYKDSEWVEDVVLSEENDWTYQWKGDASYIWHVKEIEVPDGYTVVYRWNETQYLIINSMKTVKSSTVVPPQTTSNTENTEGSDTTTESVLTSDSATSSTLGSGSTSTTDISSSETRTETVLSSKSGSSSGGSSGGSSSSSSSGKLPQTGQLWWPVPVLATGGILCLAVGWRLKHRN